MIWHYEIWIFCEFFTIKSFCLITRRLVVWCGSTIYWLIDFFSFHMLVGTMGSNTFFSFSSFSSAKSEKKNSLNVRHLDVNWAFILPSAQMNVQRIFFCPISKSNIHIHQKKSLKKNTYFQPLWTTLKLHSNWILKHLIFFLFCFSVFCLLFSRFAASLVVCSTFGTQIKQARYVRTLFINGFIVDGPQM